MSLLLDHGHQDARYYPLGMVWEEAEIVVIRLNHEHVTQTTLFQAAYLGSKSKKGASQLKKLLKDLSDG